MIREFSSRVIASNKKAYAVFFIFLALAAATVFAYSISPKFKGIIGMFTLAFIVAAVFVYTRYISSVLFYDITFDHTGEPIFVVRQITGKRQSTLARVGLAEISSVKVESRAERHAHKTPAGYKKYAYLPTLLPEQIIRLTVLGRYEKSEIIIEAGEEFANMLAAMAEEAKTYVHTDTFEEE